MLQKIGSTTSETNQALLQFGSRAWSRNFYKYDKSTPQVSLILEPAGCHIAMISDFALVLREVEIAHTFQARLILELIPRLINIQAVAERPLELLYNLTPTDGFLSNMSVGFGVDGTIATQWQTTPYWHAEWHRLIQSAFDLRIDTRSAPRPLPKLPRKIRRDKWNNYIAFNMERGQFVPFPRGGEICAGQLADVLRMMDKSPIHYYQLPDKICLLSDKSIAVITAFNERGAR